MIQLHGRSIATLAVAFALASTGTVRADDAEKFKAAIAKLSERYDDSAGDRLAAAIKLCQERIAAHDDDVATRNMLVRYHMAGEDLETAAKEADAAIAKSTKDTDAGKSARALRFLVGYMDLQAKARVETDKEKQKAVVEKLKPALQELEKVVTEATGSKEANGKLFSHETQAMNEAKVLGQLGKAPKPFGKKDTNGDEMDWKTYEGKVVLLDFWATWCGPCVKEMPNVLSVYEKLHDKGFEVIGVSLDKERKALDEYVKKNNVPWRQYFDGKFWQNEIAVAWGVQGIPATYLVDHKGKIRYVGARGPALEKAVTELLERAEKDKK